MSKRDEKPPHLSVVAKVQKLHSGKPHITNLIDALDAQIVQYVNDAKKRDISFTYAEVIGMLDILKHTYHEKMYSRRED